MSATATQGIVGKGTTIGYSAVPATTYTLLAEVTGEIPFPEVGTEDVDFTNFTSPNSHVEKKPTGWLETGDVELELTYYETQHAALLGLVTTNKTWQITLSDTHTVTFTGYIKKLGGKIPNKDRVTSTVTITVTGLPVIA